MADLYSTDDRPVSDVTRMSALRRTSPRNRRQMGEHFGAMFSESIGSEGSTA
jgi:hypothetical protein